MFLPSFRRILVGFLFLVYLTNHAHGQSSPTDSYVVLVSGDTLAGKVRERNNQLIDFQPAQSTATQRYTPDQLTAYALEGLPRLTVRLTEEGKTTTYFMQEQVAGHVGLYSLYKPEGRLTHAIRLPDKTFVPLRGSLSLLTLTQNLTACTDPAFTRLLNPQAFYASNSQFERIIKTYNNCVQPTSAVQRPRKVFRYEAGLSLIGLANSWVYGRSGKDRADYYNPFVAYKTMVTATVGAFFTIAPQKRLSLGVELLASRYRGSREIPLVDPLNPNARDSRLYSFKENYVALPITLRYVLVEGPARLYLKAGVVPAFSTALSGQYSGSSLNLNVDNLIVSKSSVGMGYLAGVGTDLTLGKKQHIYVEVRTMPHLVLDGVTRTATSRSFQLTVGVPLLQRR